MTYNGREVLTWDNFSCQASHLGSYVTEDTVDILIDSLPPLCMTSDLVQVGEPLGEKLDPATGKWRETYITFKRIAYPVNPGRPGVWEYGGHCFPSESTERWREQTS